MESAEKLKAEKVNSDKDVKEKSEKEILIKLSKEKKKKRDRKKRKVDKERDRFYDEKVESDIDRRIVIQVSQNTEDRTVWEEEERQRKKRDREERRRDKEKMKENQEVPLQEGNSERKTNLPQKKTKSKKRKNEVLSILPTPKKPTYDEVSSSESEKEPEPVAGKIETISRIEVKDSSAREVTAPFVEANDKENDFDSTQRKTEKFQYTEG
ncbi:uncharacterized protein LOC128549992 [Mercenaria mercenaria]|uniref:uncharacterized protein LOC128549992 n=1 Tax=Mercenaria mercenaria TaxID=6596 RepID=UPI00234F99E3|nr:uncharacterized protein LOC128549992 [Mercenaria mercenaria]